MSKYSEKLRDPRWQKMRLKVLEREHWMCQICADTESTLNVHHCYYSPGEEPWDAPETSLTVLCETCHQEEQADRAYEERFLIDVLRIAGLLSTDLNALAHSIYEHGDRNHMRSLFGEVFGSILKHKMPLTMIREWIKAAKNAS